MAASPECTVTVNGEKADGAYTLSVSDAVNEFDIAVTAKDQKTVLHYLLTVTNEENRLAALRQSAKEEVSRAVKEEIPSDEVKQILRETYESIDRADTEDEILEARDEGIRRILSQQQKEADERDKKEKTELAPCTHWVNKVCELYNAFCNVPLLGIIFAFVHAILHAVKDRV